MSYVVEWQVHVHNIFSIKKLANSRLMLCIYRFPDSVWFDRVQITDVLELVPVHLWLKLKPVTLI